MKGERLDWMILWVSSNLSDSRILGKLGEGCRNQGCREGAAFKQHDLAGTRRERQGSGSEASNPRGCGCLQRTQLPAFQQGDAHPTQLADAFPTIIASARLEKTSMIIQSKHPPTTTISFPLSHVPHYNIQCSLNTHRDSSSITSLGSPFQRLAAHWEKLFFIPNLNLPSCNLRPFPLVLALVWWEKRTIPTST